MDGCRTRFAAARAEVYKIDFARSRATLWLAVPASDSLTSPTEIDASFGFTGSDADDGQRIGYVGSDEIRAQIVRGDQCVGLLRLLEPRVPLKLREEDFLTTITSMCALLFEKEQTLKLLAAIQAPINYHQNQSSFLEDLVLLIADASSMPFIALRELVDQTRLSCVVHFGFPPELPREELDLNPISEFPSFEQAIASKRTVVESDCLTEKLASLRDLAWFSAVRSFVVIPIVVCGDVFGTLSFGSTAQYTYSHLELAGLEGIANTIGSSLTNYRNFHEVQENINSAFHKGVNITAVEVAQAARHEARTHISTAQIEVQTLAELANKGPRIPSDFVKRQSEIIEATLEKIGITLDKIKAVTKPPDRQLAAVDICEVWEQAFQIVQGRLIHEHIEYNVDGPAARVRAYPDWLVQAFLNLILNSIDAYRGNSRRAGRRINVRIEKLETARSVRLTYTDNATGIDASKLSVPEKLRDVPLKESIFHAGVTSKSGGSGYGLHLVRMIVNDHKGSVNLTSHRGGVQFDIELPLLVNKE